MARTSSFSHTLADRLGLGASVICLVHCLAMPFVLTGVAAWGAHGHEAFHIGVAAVSIPLALAAAWPGYREHRDRGVLALLLGGALVFGLGVVLHDTLGELAALAMSVVGSVLLMLGHVRNYHRRSMCASHTLPHHTAHHHGPSDSAH
ncbi:MAG: MerC domain-containing protein [Bacteroidetes bacterium]|nr:MerC domain-containing protein [Bacteroidota bacterium]